MQHTPTVFVTVTVKMDEWSLNGYRIIQFFMLGELIDSETGHWG